MQNAGTERPTAAFTLSAVGLAFQVLAATFVSVMAASMVGFFGGMWQMMRYTPMGSWMPPFGLLASAWVIVAGVSIGLAIWGLLLLNNPSVERVRTGSILMLIAAVLAFPTGWGFVVGSLLMLIGGILGLTWRPTGPQTGSVGV